MCRPRLTVTLVLLLLAGCHRRDMYDQPRVDTYEASPVFADHRSARPVPEGTVARGGLYEDRLLYGGTEGGRPSARYPFPIKAEDLARGRDLYGVFCTPCHGPTGRGNGMIVQRGFPAARSFHTDEMRSRPPGHFFLVITNGFGVMPAYGAQIPAPERWRIAAYVQTLQLAWHFPVGELEPGERARLEDSP